MDNSDKFNKTDFVSGLFLRWNERNIHELPDLLKMDEATLNDVLVRLHIRRNQQNREYVLTREK